MEEPLSVLDVALCDEYLRGERAIEAKSRFIREELPRGCLCRKVIRGHERHYLQWRENGKVRSRYVRAAEVEEVERGVARRRELEASIRRVARDLKKIEKVVGRESIERFRRENELGPMGD